MSSAPQTTIRQTIFLLVLSVSVLIPAQPLPPRIDSVVDTSTLRDYEWGVHVESEDGSTVFATRDTHEGYIPASNQKILTTSAAFGLLGANSTFETRILYTGSLSGSTITGNIILLGFHDITWNTSVFGSGNANAALDYIAQRVRNAGVTQVNGSVIGYGAMLYNFSSTSTGHQSTSSSSVAARNSEAAAAFRSSLISAGVSVSGGSSGQSGFNPSGTLLLTYQSNELNGAVYSSRALTLDAACIALNRPSHNAMADLLLRHIGYQLRGQDSYAAGETECLDWFQNVAGIDATGIDMTDGSGLSRYNRVSPKQMVDLFRYAVDAFPTYEDTLAVSGVTGTLGGRLTDIAGDVKGKTGTLPNTGVVSLSGFVNNDDDGQRYYFSILVNTPGSRTGTQAISTTTTRAAIDDVVRLFGKNTSLPYAPAVVSGRNIGSGKVRLEWSFPGHNAEGFTIYGSDDGINESIVAEIAGVRIIESATGGLNNGDYSETGTFESSSAHSEAPGLSPGIGSRFARPQAVGAAFFRPTGLVEGPYLVDVTSFDFISADANNTQATLSGAAGDKTILFELSEQTAGSQWLPVGEILFKPGQNHGVSFSNHIQTSTGSDDRMNPAATRWTPLFWEESGLAPGQLRYYRIALKGPGGISGKVSDLVAVRVSNSPSVLVVDGFDRWDFYGDNDMIVSHDFSARTAASIPSWAPSDCAANEAVLDGRVDLDNYKAVVWIAGEESTADETFSPAEQPNVVSFLASGGGGLFVSGAEIAWELGGPTGPTSADTAFLNNQLRANYSADDAGTYNVTGVGGGPFAGISGIAFDNGSSGTYNVDWPDILTPNGAGASAALNYSGGSGGVAAVAYNGSAGGGKSIFFGFPFETITSEPVRNQVMEAALRYLGLELIITSGWAIF